ncbi:MAG: hypothetical protein KIT17_18245 [Rubrivivax sp.]|nr:hypothetical protein [Rubrivivax sp.]
MANEPQGAALPASVATDTSAGTPAPGAARPAAAAPPAAPPATAWAVSTRPLRTRFESEQMLAALRDVAYRSGYGNELRLEVMPAGDDWRAIGWPLATRAEAERLRATLVERGLKAEVVQF